MTESDEDQEKATELSPLFGESVDPSSLGGRLRAFVAWRGYSLREFSAKTEIGYRSLQRYVANAASPGADHIARIGRVGVNIGWLVTGEIPSLFTETLAVDFKRPVVSLFCADEQLLKEVFQRATELTSGYFSRAGSAYKADAQLVVHALYLYAAAMIVAGARAAENCRLKTKLSAASREMIRRIALTGADDIPDSWIRDSLAR